MALELIAQSLLIKKLQNDSTLVSASDFSLGNLFTGWVTSFVMKVIDVYYIIAFILIFSN